MDSNIRKKLYLMMTFMVFLTSISITAAFAGTSLSRDDVQVNPARRVELRLYGAERFRAVQLFDYLLGEVPEVSDYRQVSLQISPEEPQASLAVWSVATVIGTTGELQNKLLDIIRGLDSEGQNDILYDAPFIVMKEDLEMVKKIIPVTLSEGYIAFAVDGRVVENAQQWNLATPTCRLPWYKTGDRGFD